MSKALSNSGSSQRGLWQAFGTPVIAGLFTLLGVVLGVALDRHSQALVLEQIRKHEVAQVTVKRAQARWARAWLVSRAAGSDRFKLRWEEYMLGGFTPWNGELPLMRKGLERHFPRAIEPFENLGTAFGEQNGLLVGYYRSGGKPSSAQATQVEESIEHTRELVEQLVEAVLE